jgi:hypothetical protein
VHFDPAHPVVPDRAVPEGIDRHVGVEIGIDAIEQIEVERGGDAGRVVIAARSTSVSLMRSMPISR